MDVHFFSLTLRKNNFSLKKHTTSHPPVKYGENVKFKKNMISLLSRRKQTTCVMSSNLLKRKQKQWKDPKILIFCRSCHISSEDRWQRLFVFCHLHAAAVPREFATFIVINEDFIFPEFIVLRKSFFALHHIVFQTH